MSICSCLFFSNILYLLHHLFIPKEEWINEEKKQLGNLPTKNTTDKRVNLHILITILIDLFQ